MKVIWLNSTKGGSGTTTVAALTALGALGALALAVCRVRPLPRRVDEFCDGRRSYIQT